MSYCLYLRKSRADAEAELRGEGETLARHEKILIELAKKQNLNISKIYKEIVSGETIAARPVMQELLSEVEQGMWSGVIVMEVERLARGDTIDQGIMAQTFKYSNTKIITPNKTYDPNNEFDEEYFEFGLFMSRREYKTINRRLQRGRLESIKEGKFMGGSAPYGYTLKKLNDKGNTLEIHPEESEVVKLIFDLFTRGEKQSDGTYKRLGTSLIANKLNDLKITAKHFYWKDYTILRMLRNHSYIGKIIWKQRPEVNKIVDGKVKKTRIRSKDFLIVDGLHSPIIDIETFNCANEILNQKLTAPCKNILSIKNPLSGIVQCEKCGKSMLRTPYTLQGIKDSLKCRNSTCDNISSYLEDVEEAIIKSLEIWLNNYRAQLNKTSDKIEVDSTILEKHLKNIEIEIDTSNKQQEKLYDLLEQGVYTSDVFLDRSRILSEKVKELKTAYSKLQKELERFDQDKHARIELIPKIDAIIKTYNTINDPAIKNAMLKQVIEKVTYLKTVKIRGEFQVIVYPKLTST